jgi:hypothetical protein
MWLKYKSSGPASKRLICTRTKHLQASRCRDRLRYSNVCPDTVLTCQFKLSKYQDLLTFNIRTSGIPYVTVGHDDVEFLFADLFSKSSCHDDAILSAFLGGCGDCRHIYRTLVDLARLEQNGDVASKLYHFTANDVHYYTLARNLVVWALLQELSELKQGTDEATLVLTTLSFVWVSPMMPEKAHRKLHQAIRRVWMSVKSEKQPISWAYLHKKDFNPLSKALYYWDTKVDHMVTGAEVISRVIRVMENYKSNPGIMNSIPAQCKKEFNMYCQSAGLRPPQRFMELHDKGMLGLLRTPGSQSLEGYIKENWRVNVTMVAVDDIETSDVDLSVDHNPFTEIGRFDAQGNADPRPSSLLDYVSLLLSDTARSLKNIKDRLKIEIYQGDMVDLAEELQFGLLDDSRPMNFPVTYHKLALSNVP